MRTNPILLALVSTFSLQPLSLQAFEGRINAAITQGSRSDALLYTVGTNFLRVEMTATNWPNPVDILDRNSGAMILLFPHNRSFVRLKPAADNSAATPPGYPLMHGGLPPGVGPQVQSANVPGAPAMPAMPNMPAAGGMPSMPAMPMMPPPMMQQIELRDTGEKTNLLGFACEKFEIKQRGETLEIWVTDQLLPFQNYVRNQPHRFGPRMIEEQWGGLLTARNLFPLRASLHFDNGMVRFRFEVQSVAPQKLAKEDQKLFQPPDGYFEIEPMPF